MNFHNNDDLMLEFFLNKMLWRHFNKRPIELEMVIKKVSISYNHKINVKIT